MGECLPNVRFSKKGLDNGIYTSLFFISKQVCIGKKEWKEILNPKYQW